MARIEKPSSELPFSAPWSKVGCGPFASDQSSSTRRAGSGHSLQVRDRKSIAKKADAQGISPFFCCANAANGCSEPIVSDAARCTNVSNRVRHTVQWMLSTVSFGVPNFSTFLDVYVKDLPLDVVIQRRIGSVKIWISMVFSALCAGSSAFIYDANGNPGHGPMSPWYMAGAASIAASVWAFFVFPRMGRWWVADGLWIAAAYPCVGAITGSLVAVGHPLGIYSGALVAINLPLQFPLTILPIYIFGAALAFLLPRILQSA